MTYQHALRYFHTPDGAAEHLPSAELRAFVGALPSSLPTLICLSADKQGRVMAELIRAVLVSAGISCLHFCDDALIEPRERLLLDGKPVPPPVLCAITQHCRDLEIALHRMPDAAGDAFFPDERRAALFLRLAIEQNVSVILLQSNETRLHDALDAFAKLSSLTLVSATDEGGRVAAASITKATDEVITHALGAAVIRLLSDACARCGSRLTVLPRASIRRHALSPASQTLDCHVLSDVHLAAGSAMVADAAVLVMQLILSLRRRALAISEQHIRAGLGQTVPSLCLTPVTVQPLLLLDRAETRAETDAVCRELATLADILPRPLALWCEARTDQVPEQLFDDVISGERLSENGFVLPEVGTVVAVGSLSFLNHIVSKRKKA